MLKVEKSIVTGFEDAIRGMRNPLLSYDRSDSWFRHFDLYYHKITEEVCGADELIDPDDPAPDYILGPNDKNLMSQLAKSGKDHAKYRRMIVVWLDLLAPLYWWKEFDTYKIGTVANSCSTMHKIAEKEFVRDDFSWEHLFGYIHEDEDEVEFESYCEAFNYTEAGTVVGWKKYSIDLLDETIFALNFYRKKYLETKDKRYWWQMIQLLPSSYNQRRTVMLNYEVLANIYPARKAHKLDCWHTFCDWIEGLPESWIITGEEKCGRK